MKIFKYPVPLLNNFIIELPIYSKILHFDTQNNEMFIWVAVEENNPVIDRHFYLIGTGQDFDFRVNSDVERFYIGTVQLNNGKFVWHLFEEFYIIKDKL